MAWLTFSLYVFYPCRVAAVCLYGLQGVEGELTTELKLGEAVTDERAGVFTPDKKRGTADGAGRAAFD